MKMTQKGYCCELLLAFCLLCGITGLANADAGSEVEVETVGSGGEGSGYPCEAIEISYNSSRLPVDENFVLEDELLMFLRTNCTSNVTMDSRDDSICPVSEYPVMTDGSFDYELVCIRDDTDGTQVDVAYIVVTPDGILRISAIIVSIQEFYNNYSSLVLNVSTQDCLSIAPDLSTTVSTDNTTTNVTEMETTESDPKGFPVGAIIGIVVGVVGVIILVVVIVVIIIIVVVMKKKSAVAIAKITPSSGSAPPNTSTTHGNTVPMKTFPKSDK